MSVANIFLEASLAAQVAFDECVPVPMVLIGYIRDEVVIDGVCGFAWIHIKPARGELVKWLKDNNKGNKSYVGSGYELSSYAICRPDQIGSQSMERKKAACTAFVAVIQKYYPSLQFTVHSRLD
jgi:hypothetical protein